MSKKVLVVEDDPKNLKLFRDLLQRFGFEVTEATDGEMGVEAARSGQPDLILMDIMMPKMDGLEATRIIKADPETKHIPVVALTSFAMSGDRERALAAGCDDYIAKPVDVRQLIGTVQGFCRQGVGK